MLPEKLLKPYNPQETEPRIYALWEKSGFFNPDQLPDRNLEMSKCRNFCIIMPPPNATGVLHMGHALMLTLQDILVRYKRMRGFRTLWIPGTDHAAIATQAVVEKELYKKENKTRHDLGREAFLKRVQEFVEKNRGTITAQIRVMGASCDWSREAFTLDEKRSEAVRTMFTMMQKDGLIYRGNRIVNWDPKGQTTISDDEIVYREEKTKLYTFRYSSDFPIAVATTRPETKLGDVAVAVHPDDARYKKYVGKTFDIADFAGAALSIQVVADKEVDQTFGTGAVGITPAHSHTDWDIAERHHLDKTRIIINEKARMQNAGVLVEGKKVAEAREAVVVWLREKGLMEKEEEVTHNIATAERTGGIIEPLPKLQWFVSVDKPILARGGKTLKELMRESIANGEIKIIPAHFTKTYFHWIDNLRDWCISRQIWYGHPIPAAGETDTLDTWFSAGLWTFSALGWPHQTRDLETYHPTDVLETGTDILFFWVARMILMSQYALGNIPFRTVYLNGLVRDAQGRKFSKSLGNGIDPIDIAKEFGADAGRMALIVGNTPGTDTNISREKIRGYKHFANKLWNIARFILSRENTGTIDVALKKESDALTADITADMETYRFHLAAEKIYAYVWHRLADEIIEESKKIPERGVTVRYLLENSLKLLHPFMPFVTEEIWHLLGKKQLLMVEHWPTV